MSFVPNPGGASSPHVVRVVVQYFYVSRSLLFGFSSIMKLSYTTDVDKFNIMFNYLPSYFYQHLQISKSQNLLHTYMLDELKIDHMIWLVRNNPDVIFVQILSEGLIPHYERERLTKVTYRRLLNFYWNWAIFTYFGIQR